MKFSINHRVTKEAIITIEYEKGQNKWLLAVRAAIESKANLSWADLSKADLSEANLSEADLSWANLSWANLSWANLSKANLSEADLSKADLSEADLSEADLSGADLSEANLSGANLSKANLDFSSGFTFACKTFNIKADLRLASQLAYHFCRFDFQDCEEAKQAQAALKELANRFHRVEECGRIE